MEVLREGADSNAGNTGLPEEVVVHWVQDLNLHYTIRSFTRALNCGHISEILVSTGVNSLCLTLFDAAYLNGEGTSFRRTSDHPNMIFDFSCLTAFRVSLNCLLCERYSLRKPIFLVGGGCRRFTSTSRSRLKDIHLHDYKSYLPGHSLVALFRKAPTVCALDDIPIFV